MLRRRRKRGPIGLDIGASSIKMLQVSNDDEQPTILAAAHYDLPALSSDPSESDALIRKVVTDALRRNPFQGRQVVTALGSGDYQMKNVRLPRMPAPELASAVEFEAKERFDFGEGSAQIRYIPVGEVRHGNELKEEVIVFAALEEVVQARLELLESLKLKPVAIDIAPCSAARSFIRFLRRAEDANSINVFLDVGYRGTSIIVTRGPEISFLKQIDVGSRLLNEAVAKALGISKQEAADLRIRIMREAGGAQSNVSGTVPVEMRTAVKDAVRPFMERLSRDVQLCMRYYAVTFRGQKPESLTLVGGDAHEPTLSKIISEAIDVPCLIGHPLRGMGRLGLIGGRDRRTFQPAWAVAGGLTLLGSPWVRTASHSTGSMTASAVGAVA
ncbi:MAG: pilus assembly protein PilM [Phycisphaerales bacterium]|nr:pilus assembly protein PilM [Phycisphaerales bacterium]